MFGVKMTEAQQIKENLTNIGTPSGFAVQDGRAYYYLADETGLIYKLNKKEILDPMLQKDYSLWCAKTGHECSARVARRVWKSQGRDWLRNKPWGYA